MEAGSSEALFKSVLSPFVAINKIPSAQICVICGSSGLPIPNWRPRRLIRAYPCNPWLNPQYQESSIQHRESFAPFAIFCGHS